MNFHPNADSPVTCLWSFPGDSLSAHCVFARAPSFSSLLSRRTPGVCGCQLCLCWGSRHAQNTLRRRGVEVWIWKCCWRISLSRGSFYNALAGHGLTEPIIAVRAPQRESRVGMCRVTGRETGQGGVTRRSVSRVIDGGNVLMSHPDLTFIDRRQ